MWENLLEKTTLTISFTYSHDKCEQNKYNINRHHEITRNIYEGKNKTKFIARIINDNMKGLTPTPQQVHSAGLKPHRWYQLVSYTCESIKAVVYSSQWTRPSAYMSLINFHLI